MKGEGTKICQDNYRHLVLARSHDETVHEDRNFPPTLLKRAGTVPIVRTQETPKVYGRAPRTVYKSQGVDPGPDSPPLPPWNNPRKSKVPNEELPVYDIIEEVETVLKVTEPFKKVCNMSCKLYAGMVAVVCIYAAIQPKSSIIPAWN